jgi:hypothetical protein
MSLQPDLAQEAPLPDILMNLLFGTVSNRGYSASQS